MDECCNFILRLIHYLFEGGAGELVAIQLYHYFTRNASALAILFFTVLSDTSVHIDCIKCSMRSPWMYFV